MTQVNSAQDIRSHSALRKRVTPHSLASRRAAFAAQVREMALTDLSNVSKRLKALHHELDQKDGRTGTHYALAEAMDIAPRTFQSWENGEVENRDGKGYDKMARFYSRKLGRKITRQWILFGDEAPAAKPSGSPLDDLSSTPATAADVQALRDEVEQLRDDLLQAVAELALDAAEEHDEQEGRRSDPAPDSLGEGLTGP